ncbi:hypothetical protein CLU79DRAFT_842727 [Phycomyces nitens]|nr:hypothetical protein CLU79DRAFT_842727 [Phycomyces nitens]
MTYNAYSTALQTFRLASSFLLALPAVAAVASPFARVFDTILSALCRLSLDDMGLAYSPALFDDDQDSIEWICGVKEEKTAGPVPDSLGAPLVGKPSDTSLGECLMGRPGLEPFERLFIESIDAGSVGLRLPTTMEEVREQFPDEFNRGTLKMFTGANNKRSAGTPVRRETFLGEETPFTFFAKLEGATPVRNDWLRKTYLADESDELFSEVTWKQGTSVEFVRESSQVVPDAAKEDERHDVPNEVGIVRTVYRDYRCTSVEEDESYDSDSSDDGSFVQRLPCSPLVASLPSSGWEVTEDEIADLVSRLESLSIDDASEHSASETGNGMDDILFVDDAALTDHTSIMDYSPVMITQNLDMAASNTVQQADDVGEEVASGAAPFYDAGRVGEPFVFRQEVIQTPIQEMDADPQYDGLVGNPFVFGQEAIQGLVPQNEVPTEPIDASPDVKFPGSRMDVSLGTEPVQIDGPEMIGPADAGASTAGVNDDVSNSAVMAEATVETVPGVEGEFDGRQETDEAYWDSYFDPISCPIFDSDEFTVPVTKRSSSPGEKLKTNKDAVCVPQQTASDVKGKGKEVQGQRSEVTKSSPSQGQPVKAPCPIFVFGAGDAKGSKDTLNKPSTPAFVFGTGMVPKCEFGSYNVPKLPGLYGVPPKPDKTSRPVVVPDDEARLAESSDDAEVPTEVEAFKNSQVPLRRSLMSFLQNPDSEEAF